MTTTKMTDRIRKLFAKAESTASEHEAQALLARAYDLLAKYGIEEAAARAGDADPSEVTSWTFHATGSYKHDQLLLVNGVASALHCSAIRLGKTELRVYGVRRNLDRVEMLAGLLVGYMLATAGKATNPHPWAVATVTYRKSVMLGFANEVHRRLKEAESTAASEADDSAGVALVLASDARAAERAMRAAYPSIQDQPVRRSSVGVEEGRRAGARVDLGGTRVEGRRSIGV